MYRCSEQPDSFLERVGDSVLGSRAFRCVGSDRRHKQNQLTLHRNSILVSRHRHNLKLDWEPQNRSLESRTGVTVRESFDDRR
ncbi:hypothetical protein Pmani_040181 [Petrolisthes manimaculis]|uniref:Uncharacterized protein n=1 Tax=Petrolisthes manimaculis TaxID=1843537 RepID=A0AAE1TKJ1_9EUCA|nr:hypothetical protein Pmani_040181 [Petrolisthes manimaculis]